MIWSLCWRNWKVTLSKFWQHNFLGVLKRQEGLQKTKNNSRGKQLFGTSRYVIWKGLLEKEDTQINTHKLCICTLFLEKLYWFPVLYSFICIKYYLVVAQSQNSKIVLYSSRSFCNHMHDYFTFNYFTRNKYVLR